MKRLLGSWLIPLLLIAGCAPDEPAQPAIATPAPVDEAPAAALEGSGWTGLTDPDQVITARRALMTEAERLMMPIDSFSISGPGDSAELRSAAVTIESLLLTLPHLFPPTTNLFDPTAHDPPTLALPTIWDRFAAFRTFATAAQRAAGAMAQAEDGEPLRAASARLRGACDTCHAAFMKPYTPPQVSDEDLNFDFDSVLK